MSDQMPLFDDTVPAPATATLDLDEAARSFAADPAENVVLEASAGTGKTTVLVARYVNLLARGVDPANILAMTFTRKAAAEMRDRIIRELRRGAAQATFDRARWTAIRDRMADIQISTIDAFCLSLLREFPLEADLDPGFSLADETEVPRLVDQALDRSLGIFVSRARREPDMALVLAQLGMNRTREGLAHLLQRRLVAWDVLDRFLARGPASVTSATTCAAAIDGLAAMLRGVEGGLRRFLAGGPVDHPKYQVLARDLGRLDEFRTAGDGDVRALLDRVAAHFLTAQGAPRRRDTINPYSAADYPDAAEGKRHRAEVVRLGPEVERIVGAFARDLNVVLARGVRQMFAIAQAEYRKALNDRSVLDFSDVLERAVDLLRRMDEFSQSRYRLEGRYHHVLVDEFQDTSRKQWELVSLLVRSWGEGAGLAANPSIFIVGDRKQSIYRFRDAEVTVLAEAGEFIQRLRPDGNPRRSIARSFRSVPALLSFVNDVFAEIGRDARRPDDFKYDDSDRFPVPAPGIAAPALGVVASSDLDEGAAAITAEIQRILASGTVRDKQTGLSRPARPGDIGILFRSRTSHREVETALDAAGIPTYVYKGLGFFDADEIKDMSALIRYLADPWSELRAAAFLRSRFVRLSDVALARLAPDFVGALLGPDEPRPPAELPDDDRRVLRHARAQVPLWIAQVDRVAPADLVEQLLPGTAYAYELRGPRRQQAWENLKKMRGLVRRIQNRGFATLARIADHLDSLTAGDESNAVLEALDAVNLMTVHAAKGLEFPIVFVVNMGRGASGVPPPVRVRGDDVSIGPFVSERDEIEKAREREETKRLLYVALTRARDRLYLASVLKDGEMPNGRGGLGEVLPASLKALFGRAARSAGADDTVRWTAESGRTYDFRICVAGTTTPRGPSPETGPAVDAWTAPSSGRSTSLERISVTRALSGGPQPAGHGSSATLGRLVHRLFQLAPAGTDGARLADLARSALRGSEAIAGDDLNGFVADAIALWRSVRGQADVAALLSSGRAEFEVPFSYHRPDEPSCLLRGTVDCIVDTGEALVVLELKTGARAPIHEAQLALYVEALQALYPGRRVSGRLIYPA